MERWELEYSICLCHYKEKMYATLTGRIDKSINFALLLTGSAVFADFGSNMFFGAMVACLSALSFVGEFGRKSSEASRISKEYHQLFISKDKLTDESLANAFEELNKNDSTVWNCLSVAARNRARLALYGPKKFILEDYKTFDGIMSWLAGDKP